MDSSFKPSPDQATVTQVANTFGHDVACIIAESVEMDHVFLGNFGKISMYINWEFRQLIKL